MCVGYQKVLLPSKVCGQEQRLWHDSQILRDSLDISNQMFLGFQWITWTHCKRILQKFFDQKCQLIIGFVPFLSGLKSSACDRHRNVIHHLLHVNMLSGFAFERLLGVEELCDLSWNLINSLGGITLGLVLVGELGTCERDGVYFTSQFSEKFNRYWFLRVRSTRELFIFFWFCYLWLYIDSK